MASMTRVHFAMIAKVMSESKPSAEQYDSEHDYLIALGQWNTDVFRLSEKFHETNPNYNPTRFLEACSV